MFRRKNIRLNEEVYQGRRSYFITICTSDYKKHFLNEGIINIVSSIMSKEFTAREILIYAWCFMPDHMHLLIGSEVDADIISAVSSFKQKTAYYVQKEHKIKLWQRSFFDRILRKTEDIRSVARYILENPVRKKIVADFRQYPYSGSDVFDI